MGGTVLERGKQGDFPTSGRRYPLLFMSLVKGTSGNGSSGMSLQDMRV